MCFQKVGNFHFNYMNFLNYILLNLLSIPTDTNDIMVLVMEKVKFYPPTSPNGNTSKYLMEVTT